MAVVSPPAFFAETIILLSQTLRDSATWLLPVWWVLICGIAIFFVGLILTRLNNTLGKVALISVLIFSLFSLKLEYIESFIALSESLRIGTAIFLFAIGWLLFFKLDIARRPPSIILILSALTVLVVVPLVTATDLMLKREPQDSASEPLARCFSEYVDSYEDLGDAFSSAAGNPNKADWGEANFKSHGYFEGRGLSIGCLEIWLASQISFKTTPNVYILIFDSMIPEEVSDVFFGHGSAEYGPIMKEHFYIPDGVTLQESVPTKNSIQEIMWLGLLNTPRWYNHHPYYQAFPGRINSPLLQLFRSNGYSVTTGYKVDYWGQPGPYIDHWLTIESTIAQSLLCQARGEGVEDKMAGFGVCSILGSFTGIRDLLESMVSLAVGNPKESKNERKFGSKVMEYLKRVPLSKTPQLNFFYQYGFTRHAKPSTVLMKKSKFLRYRDQFKEGSSRLAAYLADLIRVLEEKDKTSILLIAGDHGTLISGGDKWPERSRLVDRNGVAIGVLKSENECARTIGESGFTPNKNGYHTIPTVILSLVECLSGDDTIIDRLPITPIIKEKWITNSWEEFIQRNLAPSSLETLRAAQ